MTPVAVVGMDCVFPGAPDADAFWELLMRGGDAIGALPAARRDGAGFDDAVHGGFLDDIAVFDNDFFSIAPREAAAMDPQQRLLLQCAWRALEDSGRAAATLAGSDTGVFVGVMGSEWAQLHMGDYARVTPQLGAGSSTGMIANRISYHLNLKGPSLAVDTACSSSLVAVHLAVNSLLSGECTTALAAGVNLVLTPALGLVYRQMGLAAPDGRCKPFSADADGIGRSDGAGVVVLRRLEDAIADGQRVYAVIRGTAVNQDGRSNGVTAPSRWSQREVVAAACRRAGITPEEVRFVEAHGTGTVLGDIIECAALGEVHGVPREQPVGLGSVKGNIGHTEGASGIAGLIKTALALHHRIVPASRFAARENPQLRLAERGLRLLGAPVRLPAGEVVGGVSSFGMGGTNAHAVLATAPRTARTAVRPLSGAPARRQAPVGVFTVSGDTPEALRRNLAAQADVLARRPRGDAAAVCWSSNRVKAGLPYRAAFTARDTASLAAALRTAAEDERLRAGIAERVRHAPVVAFLYTGQGAQEPGMSAALYGQSPLYRRHLDAADEALRPYTGGSVRELILAEDPAVHTTRWAQPALFAVAHALTATLADLGVVPDAVLGHSIGEYPAAVAAGLLDLDAAARLVASRARHMDRLPEGGGMLAVRAGQDAVAGLLAVEPELALAAVNGPADTVLSGPRDALARASGVLRVRGIDSRELRVGHAFHSPLIAPALPGFRADAEEVLAQAPPSAPARIPFASTFRGRVLGEEAPDAAYWAEQAAAPVRFADALGALVAETGATCLVEIGPLPQLVQLAGRAGLPSGTRLLHPAPGRGAGAAELAQTLADLYRAGVEPSWDELYEPGHRRAERLAPYAFSTEHRFWQQPAARPAAAGAGGAGAGAGAGTGAGAEPAAGGGDVLPAAAVDAERDPVLAAVVEAVVQVGEYPRERVDAGARFYEDLGFDSVMIMQLKDRIETRLPQAAGITVQQLLPALRSVGTLAEFVREWITVGAAI
ncbi:beta-ketoacyl synthase N-terminal-like domain-containing protein [Streptomyces sp. NPDC046876]|uniref:type I polyketide synthase n=1 Tax=Streptomyces sp. NPDC046876 TaxID=3155616 RepID=UPI0033DB532F